MYISSLIFYNEKYVNAPKYRVETAAQAVIRIKNALIIPRFSSLNLLANSNVGQNTVKSNTTPIKAQRTGEYIPSVNRKNRQGKTVSQRYPEALLLYGNIPQGMP